MLEELEAKLRKTEQEIIDTPDDYEGWLFMLWKRTLRIKKQIKELSK